MASISASASRWSTDLSRVAVVTGASRGLGGGIAQRLAATGVSVGLCARQTPSAPPGAPAICASVDVSDHEALDEFASHVTTELGPIGLWINNAGLLDPIGPLRTAPPSEVRAHVEVNVLGVMWGSRLFARLVHDRSEGGLLVNISSGAAQSVYSGWAAYGASKAAVDHLSRVLAAEEADHGLRVVALAPGVVDTDMQALIRDTPAERFPSVARFHELKESDSFNSARWIADRIVDLTDLNATPSWVAGASDQVVLRVPGEQGGH